MHPNMWLHHFKHFKKIWCRESEGDFLPFLLVSKGKKLVARLLPFLKHDSALKILRVVTTNLPTLMSRDTDEVGQLYSCAKGNVSWMVCLATPLGDIFIFGSCLVSWCYSAFTSYSWFHSLHGRGEIEEYIEPWYIPVTGEICKWKKKKLGVFYRPTWHSSTYKHTRLELCT